MANETLSGRLQPSLFDRLIDEDPRETTESRDQRVISIKRLRECVRRDLAWLFNTTHLEAVQALDRYPYVAESVINYGSPEMSGHALANVERSLLERRLKTIIVNFEPRLLRQSLRVTAYVDQEEMSRSAITFEINGQLWAQPVPQELFLKTEVDLEVGDVKIVDYHVQ